MNIHKLEPGERSRVLRRLRTAIEDGVPTSLICERFGVSHHFVADISGGSRRGLVTPHHDWAPIYRRDLWFRCRRTGVVGKRRPDKSVFVVACNVVVRPRGGGTCDVGCGLPAVWVDYQIGRNTVRRCRDHRGVK